MRDSLSKLAVCVYIATNTILVSYIAFIWRSTRHLPPPTTVDGSEIRRSPVDMVNILLYLQGFSTIPSGSPDFERTINSSGSPNVPSSVEL